MQCRRQSELTETSGHASVDGQETKPREYIASVRIRQSLKNAPPDLITRLLVEWIRLRDVEGLDSLSETNDETV